jgi:choline trimethylamine-lyase
VPTEVLLAAQEHPEEYRDLVVRVAGYSSFFVDLSRPAQDAIIQRSTPGL